MVKLQSSHLTALTTDQVIARSQQFKGDLKCTCRAEERVQNVWKGNYSLARLFCYKVYVLCRFSICYSWCSGQAWEDCVNPSTQWCGVAWVVDTVNSLLEQSCYVTFMICTHSRTDSGAYIGKMSRSLKISGNKRPLRCPKAKVKNNNNTNNINSNSMTVSDWHFWSGDIHKQLCPNKKKVKYNTYSLSR